MYQNNGKVIERRTILDIPIQLQRRKILGDMPELGALKSRRGQLKAQLTRFINHLSNVDKNVEINRTELRCRREKNEDVWQKFEQVQSAIELLQNDEENKEATNYRVEFEDTYFKAVLLCEDLMYDRSNKQIKNQGNADVMRSNMLVPVPQVTASSGSGFCCNNSNAPIQLAAISLPTFSESLGENPRGWGSMLIHLVTSKLDISTIKTWEPIAPKDEIPPIQVLIQFLEKRFKIVEAVESVSQMNIKESSD
ncbi:hypothetical protein QTP88_012202 [Uroleucon formosanum]